MPGAVAATEPNVKDLYRIHMFSEEYWGLEILVMCPRYSVIMYLNERNFSCEDLRVLL